MSEWRVKGFVQDSDEEEDDIGISPTSSNRETQNPVERRANAAGEDAIESRPAKKVKKSGAGDEDHLEEGAASPQGLHNDRQPTYDEPFTVTQVEEDVPRSQPVTPPNIATTVLNLGESTESPDPLLDSPTPQAKRVRPTLVSSQILGRHNFSTSTANSNENKDSGRKVLDELLPPLSDSSESDLSDPPSDLDTPHPQDNISVSPTRRSTVQVVIPRPTAARAHPPRVSQQYVERSFRERKPIQLYPYLLEGERYRRDLQGRGVKPVVRVLSPPRKTRHNDQESQEQEFDPDKDPTLSSPPEIPVSTPNVRRRTENGIESSGRRKQRQSHRPGVCSLVPNGAKKRKLNPLLHPPSATRGAHVAPNDLSNNDIWSVPQSPPYSSSPPINRTGSAVRQNTRAPTIMPAPDLPTPSNSSSLRAPLDMDSDDEPLVPSVQQSGHSAPQPITIPSDSSVSNTEASESETQASDNELRKVGRKIKGVLPASWLRLDRQAQEKREKQIRDRLNALQSPERTEPQRGVAQRVIRLKGTPSRIAVPSSLGNHVIDISDESESDDAVHPPQLADARESARDAFEAAAMLDRRYADDDSDTMESDRLDLFTLGGSSRKPKVQPKLTDLFAAAKKKTSSGNNGHGSNKKYSSKRYTASRVARRTPPPALSVLDFEQSPSWPEAVPGFLRIARRQARRRPDHARQSPTNKHIRLHTAQDTEDAQTTLRNWTRGNIKPKNGIGPCRARSAPRTPLVDKDENPQDLQHSPGHSDADIASKERAGAVTQKARLGGPRHRPSGLCYVHRKIRNGTEEINTTSSWSKSVRPGKKNSVPFRNAQLEGPATEYGSSDRRAAFERGLQRVDRQFYLQQPLQPSRNLQITRFLTGDDVALSPLCSVKDVEEGTPAASAPILPTPKRRLKGKPQAQRIDVETRKFRQPSEPVADDFLNTVSGNQISNSPQNEREHPLLEGLGPYGTRYSTTFDVAPLQDGTYFHVSTFVGSGALHRALAMNRTDARNLDEPAGYGTIDIGKTSLRCGPWEDSVFAHLVDSTSDMWSATAVPDENDETQMLQENSFDKASKVLRSLVDYIAKHLSFHDPIDRKSFVRKMEQWAASLFGNIKSNCLSGAESTLPVKTKALALLLVLCVQIRGIAQHPVMEQPADSDLVILITNISKSLVEDILDNALGISKYLEDNKRYKVRENGIQSSDVTVESLVVCMHSLSEANIPGTTFWELVGKALSPAARRALHFKEFESVWSTVFALLPFAEFNDLGVPMLSRRTSFGEDNWTVIRALLQRLFSLYPETAKAHSASLNDYVRAVLIRCHELIQFWNWKRCEPALYAMFDFFVAKNGLKHLRNEACNGSATFLEETDDRQFFRIAPNEKSFHIFLKCLFVGIKGMGSCHADKKLRSVVLRLIPNHGRSYPKDQPLETESLEALRNHHDILCTLYRASPMLCRPRLEQIKTLVHHENSHREACRIAIRAWANLATFQLSTDQPYSAVRPFAEWHKEIMLQTLKQYRLAKTEAEDFLKYGVFNNNTEATSSMVRQTMEKNQEQVIAALRDCLAGMLRAVAVRNSQVLLEEFIVDSGLVHHLLELPHLQDQRLIVVIRDALGVIQAFARLPRQPSIDNIIPEQNEESQDYGDSFDLDDVMEIDQEMHPPDDVLQTPLWHLLSNAFGAEAAPDDNLLMDAIDTWCLVARNQVSSGTRTWTFYLDPFSPVSWQQLRRTEQTQKFGPYFMASILECDSAAYPPHRTIFLNALLVSLAERESMLRFQHRLLGAITRTATNEPVTKNLPFFGVDGTGSLDITADTLRTRRLTLISSILSNMRDDFQNTLYEHPEHATEVKGNYAAILKDFMAAMKINYQQLGFGTTVTGAYVEFVQKVVQFLQQYTADIQPVLDFFTNSVAFPLPAADPTYVVGRLCGYASKISRAGIAKTLSVFVQTVAQQAATGGHQPYLVHQLRTALCTDEAPARDRIALRDVLLQGVFPAYIEAALTSPMGFFIAKPILQSLGPVVHTMTFDIRVFNDADVRAVCDSLLSIAHAFIRSTEQIKQNGDLLKQPHILQALALMLQIMLPISRLLRYICDRRSESSIKPLVVTYFEQLALFIGEVLHGMVPQTVPYYAGDATTTKTYDSGLLSFAGKELKSSIKTNWNAVGDCIYFGQGYARREVFPELGTAQEEAANLVGAIEVFLGSVAMDGEEEDLGVGDLVSGVDV